MVGINKDSSGNNIKTREFRGNYVLPLNEPTDVVEDEYRAGRVKPPFGTNRIEFPYRSIIRGDYESKHFGTIKWEALEEFKIFYLDTVLSGEYVDENGDIQRVKLPLDLWEKARDKYIETQLDIIESERTRYQSNYEYHWANNYYDHDFFAGQVGGSFSYGRRYGDYYNNNHSYNYGYILLDDITETSEEDSTAYTYKTPIYTNGNWFYNDGGVNYAGGANGSSSHFRLGYETEFKLWMPEYHRGNHNQGSSVSDITVQTGTDPITGDPIFEDFFNYNNYGGTTYSDEGMLDDMVLFLNNLKDIKYDYSNLDDCFGKNFLYFKLEDPRIPLTVEAPQTVNNYEWPYVNEVYLYEKGNEPKSILADVWTNWPVCKNPDNGDSISDPDIAGRDWWLTIADHQGYANDKDEWRNGQGPHAAKGTDWGLLKQRRPIQYAYTFNDKLLFYGPNTSPLIHNERDPRIIDGVEYKFSTENGQPNELLADESGLRFYIVGAKTDHVYQYSLSENYDLIPIVKYDDLKHSLLPQDKSSTEAWWRPNGRRYWVISIHSDTIHQYDTVEPWTVESNYENISYDVTEQDEQPQGISWRPNGMRMFICGWQNSKIYQYDMKQKPWTLEKINADTEFNAEFAGDLDVSLQDTKPVQMLFNNTGVKLYMLGQDTTTLYEYNCGKPFDITTAVYNNVFLDVGSQEQSPESFYIGKDGTKLYVVGANASVYEYNMDAYDISNAMFTTSIQTQDKLPTGITFSVDGKKMFVVGSDNDYFYEYDITTERWTVNNAATNSVIRDLSEQEGGPQGIYFNSDGSRMFTVGNSVDAIEQWDLPAGDLSVVIPAGSMDVSAEEISPTGLHFKNNGKEVFIVGPENDKVVWYLLKTAWDVTTKISKLGEYDLRDPGLTNIYPTDIRFSDDGTKMYISDLNTDSIHQFDLERPWEPPSAQRVKFKKLGEEPQPQGFWFSPDGLNLFVVGTSTDLVLQYLLTTPWEIDTAGFTGKVYSVQSEDNSPRAIAFSNPPYLFSMVPVRAKFEGVNIVRDGTKILKIDSNVFETEGKVDKARDDYLPRILDRRLTYYDNNVKETPLTHEVLDDYKINIVREKNG